MSNTIPGHWLNIGKTDAETRAIDEMAAGLEPFDASAIETRKLITRLECCHFNALLYVDQIIRAIGDLSPSRAQRTSRSETLFPTNEKLQRDAAVVLRAWCAGAPPGELDLKIGDVPGSELVRGLGVRTPLKEWQVQRVVERFEFRSPEDLRQNPAFGYVPMLVSGSYEAVIATDCPPRYLEHADFRDKTVQTMIHDTLDGEDAEISLAWAIDLLMPCHWDFVSNLVIVLNAIGGDLHPNRPLELCARNIRRSPSLDRLDAVCRTLRAYDSGDIRKDGGDPELLRDLGAPTPVGRWLVASLEKTVREQLGLRREAR